MRNFARSMIVAACLLMAPLPLAAATPGEFYSGLLRRGVASFDAGRYEEASRLLRIAAFGTVDSIPQYETAQAYLALAFDRLGQADRAREAARRVLVAERVENRYAALPLPTSIRTAFEALAARLLTPTELANLQRPPTSGRATTTTQNPPAAVVPPPQKAPAQVREVETTVIPASEIQPAPAPPAAAPRTTTTVVTPPPPAKQDPPAATSVASQQPVRTPPQNPAPVQTTAPPATQTTTPPAARPPAPKPAPVPAAVPQPRPIDVTERLASADAALSTARLTEARAIYRELAASSGVPRDALIRVAEGAYRARDFQTALAAFERIGALRSSEEPYRYYIAVSLYETGQYARARQELAAALPFIRITPDVERYRLKIEGSIN